MGRDFFARHNWVVTTYDENDDIKESYIIENRTHKEAAKEAMSSPEVQASDDWTLMPRKAEL